MLRKLFLLVGLFLLLTAPRVFAAEAQPIQFFYGEGCAHCTEVERFFSKNNFYEQYPLEKREIYFNHDNALLYTQLMDERSVPPEKRGVPAVIMGEQVLIGDQPIIMNFVPSANQFLGDERPTIPAAESTSVPEQKGGDSLTLAAVIGASLVDAINPCAFAVLIILMSALQAAGLGKKAFKAGLAFAASIFISYFLMGLGLYTALGVGGLAGSFFTIIGWVAIVLGLLNLKDYFWYGQGFLMEVPMSWRPKLKSLIRTVTSPAGAFGVGFLVSLFLLPCTSGPYIVILGMLAKNTLQIKAILYLLLYNLIFVLPMVLISWIVSKGFDPKQAELLRQKRLRTLHLIAGIVMLLMGGVILAGWI